MTLVPPLDVITYESSLIAHVRLNNQLALSLVYQRVSVRQYWTQPFPYWPIEILLIFDKCSILLLTQSWHLHTSCLNLYFNEFAANILCGNIGSKKSALSSLLRKLNESKIQGQCKPYNQTQLHKVNDFDSFFVSKCLYILNSRTELRKLDFQCLIWCILNILTTLVT